MNENEMYQERRANSLIPVNQSWWSQQAVGGTVMPLVVGRMPNAK